MTQAHGHKHRHTAHTPHKCDLHKALHTEPWSAAAGETQPMCLSDLEVHQPRSVLHSVPPSAHVMSVRQLPKVTLGPVADGAGLSLISCFAASSSPFFLCPRLAGAPRSEQIGPSVLLLFSIWSLSCSGNSSATSSLLPVPWQMLRQDL